MEDRQFDVFLAHRSVDKPLIRPLYHQLKARGLKPWLDEEEIPPGTSFQDELQQAISQVKAAAICIGASELSRWQSMELRTFISQCVERNIPVIPVLLPGITTIPESLLFLRQFHAVSFQNSIEEERALFRLEWGVTGRKPTPPKDDKSVPVAEINAPLPKRQTVPEPALDARYADLERYLKSGQWEKADRETYRLMITAVGKAEGEWFDSEDLLHFPCEPLKVIDGLWVGHSKGRFGFSVQKELYQECGGILDGEYHEEAWDKFCQQKNGWNDTPDYDLASPRGHLPILLPTGGLRLFSGDDEVLDDYEVLRIFFEDFFDDGMWKNDLVLFSRTETCKL